MRIPLRLQSMLIALTLINLGIGLGILGLGILGVIVSHEQAAASASPDGILRGRGLQIVDDRGNVRASITIHPAARQPDGSIYPETVLLRMITSQGRPAVKIASSEDGAGLVLSAAEGPAYVQVLARGNDPKLVIVDSTGRETSKLP